MQSGYDVSPVHMPRTDLSQKTVLNQKHGLLVHCYMWSRSNTYHLCWLCHPESHDCVYLAEYLENLALRVTCPGFQSSTVYVIGTKQNVYSHLLSESSE